MIARSFQYYPISSSDELLFSYAIQSLRNYGRLRIHKVLNQELSMMTFSEVEKAQRAWRIGHWCDVLPWSPAYCSALHSSTSRYSRTSSLAASSSIPFADNNQ